jgi:hypothetical protein
MTAAQMVNNLISSALSPYFGSGRRRESVADNFKNNLLILRSIVVFCFGERVAPLTARSGTVLLGMNLARNPPRVS